MLLYLIIKNHSFVDGNKRIAEACFMKFLQAKDLPLNVQNELVIGKDASASLILLIATSKLDEMEAGKNWLSVF